MGTYSLRRRLDIRVIHRLRALPHRRRKPPKPLRQRRHRIFLKVVKPRSPSPRPSCSPAASPRRILDRQPAAEARELPALRRRQGSRPRRILGAQLRKVRLVALLSRAAAASKTPFRRGASPTTIAGAGASASARQRRTRPFPPQVPFLAAVTPRQIPLHHARVKLPPLDPRRQPLFVLLPDLALIPLLDGRVLKRPALRHGDRVLVEEPLPDVVPAVLHALGLGVLERVHGDGAHEGDVHAEAAVRAGAVQADEGAEFRGGLVLYFPGLVVFGL